VFRLSVYEVCRDGDGKGWDVATGQHSVQSVEIDGDFGVKIGRSRYVGRDGQDRLAKGGHVWGNPAQIWGEQGLSQRGGRLSSTLLGRKGCPQ